MIYLMRWIYWWKQNSNRMKRSKVRSKKVLFSSCFQYILIYQFFSANIGIHKYQSSMNSLESTSSMRWIYWWKQNSNRMKRSEVIAVYCNNHSSTVSRYVEDGNNWRYKTYPILSILYIVNFQSILRENASEYNNEIWHTDSHYNKEQFRWKSNKSSVNCAQASNLKF